MPARASIFLCLAVPAFVLLFKDGSLLENVPSLKDTLFQYGLLLKNHLVHPPPSPDSLEMTIVGAALAAVKTAVTIFNYATTFKAAMDLLDDDESTETPDSPASGGYHMKPNEGKFTVKPLTVTRTITATPQAVTQTVSVEKLLTTSETVTATVPAPVATTSVGAAGQTGPAMRDSFPALSWQIGLFLLFVGIFIGQTFTEHKREERNNRWWIVCRVTFCYLLALGLDAWGFTGLAKLFWGLFEIIACQAGKTFLDAYGRKVEMQPEVAMSMKGTT